MPRVSAKKKNKAGEPYACDRCTEKIVAGQGYYEWSFRYGGTHRQHTSHGAPKASQLTQSKMSAAYAAIESAEDSIAGADNVEDIRSALEECASEIENVKDEYQESRDNMPEALQDGPTGEEIGEKVEALESFAGELSDAASNLEEFGEEEPDDADSDEHTAWQERYDEHLEEQRTAAEEALGNLSI